MITTTRAEVESQTRSYFQPRTPPAKVGPLVKLTDGLVKIPDDVRAAMQESSARDAAANQRHQEYLARDPIPQESLYTQYGKLTTDAEREAFIQKQVDEVMVANAFFNECERRGKEAAAHGTSGYTPNWPPNSVIRSAAIGMYQSVQSAGDAPPPSEQGTGEAA